MFVAVICVSVMATMIFALGLLVSTRRTLDKSFFYGATPDPTSPLTKAVRAHGNAAEWVPILSILMLYLGTTKPAAWVVWDMVFLAVCRVLAATGFLTCASLANIHPLKAIGGMGTYFGGLALCVAAVLSVI